MTERASMAAGLQTEWVFASCDTEHSASAARVKCSQIAPKARLSPAVCRCKPMHTFVPYHDMKPQAQRKSRVIVIEDHPLLCDGLKQLIGSQPDLACIGVADNTSDAKRLVEECKPDLLLLDLRLKGGDALELIK